MSMHGADYLKIAQDSAAKVSAFMNAHRKFTLGFACFVIGFIVAKIW